MKVFVHGLWHLGSVTAACCAAAGHETVGCDPDADVVNGLGRGRAPLLEPGLDELVQAGLASDRLRFTTDESRVTDADVAWIAFDTPVDADDIARTDVVLEAVRRLFPHVRDGAVVLVSSQLPAGSVRALAAEFAAGASGRRVDFACSPENLRLGKALDAFQHPERIVVGVDSERASRALEPLLTPFCANLIQVSVPSAEVVKHATNAYLATCVTFMNEVALVCEQVGADAREVERALRTEPRIGRHAYIRPGAAFAGGTLARDVRYLQAIAAADGMQLPLMDGLVASNEAHRSWPLRQLVGLFGGDLRGVTVAVLGLAYKPGTSTLRRSHAVELAREILRAGGRVRGYDPAIPSRPDDLPVEITLCKDIATALQGVDVAVVATAWPDIAALSVADLVAAMPIPRLIDADGVLAATCRDDRRVAYSCVGSAP